MELAKLTIHELQQRLKKREIKSIEIVEDFIKRIKYVDKNINSYITLAEEFSRNYAVEADKKISNNEFDSPLLGIPLGVKDLICTEGIKTTCGSKMLNNFIPPYDATVIKKLKDCGAIILGKLNMDEFAMGSSTETSIFGATKNPWNMQYVTGGSSGGSAAAVSADECAAALGSDTGGSIRQPASFCGIVGLKPTYGRVSRFGLIAFASSLDQIGPMTKDVEDAAILMNVICGKDSLDTTSANIPVPDFTNFLKIDIKGMKIGIPDEYFSEGIDPEVEKTITDAIFTLEKLGAVKVKISLPYTKYAVPTYYVLAPAEASSNLSRYDGVKYGYRAEETNDLIKMYKETRENGFGTEVKRRIMLGTFTLSSGYYDDYYIKAQKARTLIKTDFDNAFKKCDIIVAPVSPTAAFKIKEKKDDPLRMYLSDIFTLSVNLSGGPAISIPCGFTKKGLPVGLQIIGKNFDEGRVLQAAYSYEQNTKIHLKKPII